MNVSKIVSFLFIGYLQVCAALSSGYLTFSPTTSAYSQLCPNVINYNGRQPVSLNAVQFGVKGDQCGKCIRIKRSVPTAAIKALAIVTNVLPQGFAGDLDAPVPGRTGVGRVSWEFEECGFNPLDQGATNAGAINVKPANDNDMSNDMGAGSA